MQDVLKPIKTIWFLKTLPIFTVGFLFFIILAIRSNNQNIIFALIFFLLIILTILEKENFSLVFDRAYLKVKQFGLKQFGTGEINIPYEKIMKIYIRQSPIDKILYIKSMIIQFDSPFQQSRVEIKTFGKSIKTILGLEIPGTYGNLLTIPGITPESAENLKDKILELSKPNPPEVINMGIGYPYYNQLFRFSYIMDIVLILIVISLFIFALIFYFIL